METVPRDQRWAKLGTRVAVGLPVAFGVLWLGFLALSRDPGYATVAAALQALASAGCLVLVARATWAHRPTGRRQLGVVLASWALLPALMATLVLHGLGLALGWSVLVGVAVGAVATVAYRRYRTQVTALQVLAPMTVNTLSDAELLRTATSSPVTDPRTPPAQAAMQRLNHARALTVLALRESESYRVQDALPLLRDALRDPAVDPAVALMAAEELVSAESMLAQRGGDGSRYRQAVDLYAVLVKENPAITVARAKLHEHRAGYHQFLCQQATEDLQAAVADDDEAAADDAMDRCRDAFVKTERELRKALAHTGPSGGLRAQYLSMLGTQVCLSTSVTGTDRADEGVRMCRDALRVPGLGQQRPMSEFQLARALFVRGAEHGGSADLDEAARLARGLFGLDAPLDARLHELLMDIDIQRTVQ